MVNVKHLIDHQKHLIDHQVDMQVISWFAQGNYFHIWQNTMEDPTLTSISEFGVHVLCDHMARRGNKDMEITD